ncbi:MAG: glycosyltransferase family 4 protein [Pseudomonadota bacterium]
MTAAFAIPGDIATLTGGYIYERRLLEGLRALGRDVAHIVLGDTFPHPTAAHMADAAAQLAALPPSRALILDGLVFGSIETAALARVRAPVVAMLHHPLALENGLSPSARGHLYRTERDNLTLAAHVLVTSPHTAAQLTADYGVAPDRITVARPGTDRPTLAPAPKTPPLILSVGIQHPRKGHDIFLRALSLLPKEGWEAVIVGSPYEPTHAAELGALHTALGLGECVQLAGRVSADTLAQLYAQASIFALATRYEGYGIVFDEAIANGLPIVTCRTGAVPETVPQDAGLLVPPEDPPAFAAALSTLLSDPARRAAMASAAREAAATLPSWRDTAHIAANVLDRVATG